MPLQFQSFSHPAKPDKAPVVAIDMGFSREGESCGFATNWSRYPKVRPLTKLENGVFSENLTFGQAVGATANVTRSHTALILILEAPLSCHWKNGNPCARHAMENHCPWYYSAGAVTALAAQCFLHRLAVECGNAECRIHLIEGFVTGEDSRNHRVVAKGLLARFVANSKSPQKWAGTSMPGAVLGPESSAPLVLTIRD